uniref:Uncharacterized protein n=1 Tax=Myoviridae sp. ct3OK4 TaxID=2825024 RepID=A0A8S5NX36_9CAUD|nr:MAG TPA: hypothetical protein [Myoviridae sp. ct3OK4]
MDIPPPTHKVQFFYEQIYITLQIPSRTPLPAYTQPTYGVGIILIPL